MNKTLLTRLVLPLSCVFLAAIAAHVLWTADGFFLNLAAGILCILITVLYVEWILREHERERWQSTDARIANRLRILLNATVSGIRDGIGFGPEVLGDLAPFDALTMHRAVMLVAERVIAPALDQRIKELDHKGWESLARRIQNGHDAILSFFGVFQTRLAPEQIALLLDLQEALSRSALYWSVYPDVMGVPEDQLPRKKTPGRVLQTQGCECAVKELRKSLELAKKLSATLREELPPSIGAVK